MSRVSLAVRQEVIRRDEGRCFFAGGYLVDPSTMEPQAQYSVHHRTPRGMGGSKNPAINSTENLLLLSGTGTTGAHGWVESNRAQALAYGLLVPSWAEPALTPVKHWVRGPVLLWGPRLWGLHEADLVLERFALARGLESSSEAYGRAAEYLADRIQAAKGW